MALGAMACTISQITGGLTFLVGVVALLISLKYFKEACEISGHIKAIMFVLKTYYNPTDDYIKDISWFDLWRITVESIETTEGVGKNNQESAVLITIKVSIYGKRNMIDRFITFPTESAKVIGIFREKLPPK